MSESKNINVNVSLVLSLGKRLVAIGDRVVGECEEIIINVAEAKPEEVIELMKAPVVKLLKPPQVTEVEKGMSTTLEIIMLCICITGLVLLIAWSCWLVLG